MSKMTVKMFGDFTVTYDGVTVSDSDNRSKKLWLLLAYLLYNRDRVLKQNELIELLWSESERGANPTGALKTLFYRLRAELDKLFDGAGKQLIVSRNNGYIWNRISDRFWEYSPFCRSNDRPAHFPVHGKYR